jgi:hypothetical protein
MINKHYQSDFFYSDNSLILTLKKNMLYHLLSNSNHNPFKLCCLCGFVSPLGLS